MEIKLIFVPTNFQILCYDLLHEWSNNGGQEKGSFTRGNFGEIIWKIVALTWLKKRNISLKNVFFDCH